MFVKPVWLVYNGFICLSDCQNEVETLPRSGKAIKTIKILHCHQISPQSSLQPSFQRALLSRFSLVIILTWKSSVRLQGINYSTLHWSVCPPDLSEARAFLLFYLRLAIILQYYNTNTEQPLRFSCLWLLCSQNICVEREILNLCIQRKHVDVASNINQATDKASQTMYPQIQRFSYCNITL